MLTSTLAENTSSKFQSFIVCTIYRPPNTTTNCFDKDLLEMRIFRHYLLVKICTSRVISCDMNGNMLNPGGTGCQTLLHFCLTLYLKQLVKQPTRITETSITLRP